MASDRERGGLRTLRGGAGQRLAQEQTWQACDRKETILPTKCVGVERPRKGPAGRLCRECGARRSPRAADLQKRELAGGCSFKLLGL